MSDETTVDRLLSLVRLYRGDADLDALRVEFEAVLASPASSPERPADLRDSIRALGSEMESFRTAAVRLVTCIDRNSSAGRISNTAWRTVLDAAGPLRALLAPDSGGVSPSSPGTAPPSSPGGPHETGNEGTASSPPPFSDPEGWLPKALADAKESNARIEAALHPAPPERPAGSKEPLGLYQRPTPEEVAQAFRELLDEYEAAIKVLADEERVPHGINYKKRERWASIAAALGKG